jgi:protein-S-isoprenylcysteine O-methyltransferase Ste14
MLMIYIQIIGCGFFFLSTIVLGIFLRKYPLGKVRETTTMALHFIIFVTFLIPVLMGIFYPGIFAYDDLLGIKSLPYKPLRMTIGVILIPIGIFLVVISNFALFNHGHGQAAFFPTKHVVNGFIYKITRNPMSLGFYSGCLALGCLSGSTYFTLWILIEVIPVHIFFLKFFEEKELELRFGNPYMEYRKKVPFLIPTLRKESVSE